MSADLTSLSLTADVAGTTPPPSTIQITVANPPASAFAFQVVSSGTAITSASFNWQSPAQGQLTIVVPNPAQLGPGSYQGQVVLSICIDADCHQLVGGSPISIAVSYVVTAMTTSGPPPTFSLQESSYRFEAHTADPAPAASFQVQLKNVPAAGLYVNLFQPPTGFIVQASYTQSDVSDGSIILTISLALETPRTIGSGFFASSVTFEICLDQACTQQLAGSPVTEPIDYTVFLTEGQEYKLLALDLGGISDIAYDAIGNKLYLSGLTGYPTSYSGAVSQIDPMSGALGTQILLSDNLFGIATSDDGSLLYVGSQSDSVVHRLTLPSLTADLDIQLGNATGANMNGNVPNTVSELAVAPGAAHTVAISLGQPSSHQTAGTVIFDDATPRSESIAPLGYNAQPDAIAWGPNANTLYLSRFSYQLPDETDIATATVSSAGLVIASSVSIDSSKYYFGRTFYGPGRAYDARGSVFDLSTGVQLGQFTLPVVDPIVALLPDPTHGRVFILQPDGTEDQLLLLSYDASTFALQSVVNMGFDMFDVALTTHLIAWGADGVAFNRNGVQILSGSFSAPPVSTAAVHKVQHAAQADLKPRTIAMIHAPVHGT